MGSFKKIFKIIAAIGISFFLLLIAIAIFTDDKNISDLPKNTKSEENKNPTWNTKNTDAFTNGNMQLAAKYIKSNAPSSKSNSPADVLKRPWEHYGKYLCFDVTVSVAEDYPPGSDVAKMFDKSSATEIVGTTPDDVIIDLIAAGSSGSLTSGSSAELCGYPVGRTEVPNQVGGKYTHLVIIGKR